MLEIKVKNEAFHDSSLLNAADMWTSKRTNKRKTSRTYKRSPLLGRETVTQKCRQCYLPVPKQKSCIKWPRYTKDEPNRTEIATGAFS